MLIEQLVEEQYSRKNKESSEPKMELSLTSSSPLFSSLHPAPPHTLFRQGKNPNKNRIGLEDMPVGIKNLFIYLFVFLFIFGCVGSSLPHAGFL